MACRVVTIEVSWGSSNRCRDCRPQRPHVEGWYPRAPFSVRDSRRCSEARLPRRVKGELTDRGTKPNEQQALASLGHTEITSVDFLHRDAVAAVEDEVLGNPLLDAKLG